MRLATLIGSSMESLLAYASSDEDEDAPPPQPRKLQPPPPSLPGASSLFSSLPKPQSTFLSSLPPPKKSSSSSQFLIPDLRKPTIDYSSSEISDPGSSKLFSVIPGPKKSQNPGKPLPPKRVIQIRPPVNPSFSTQIGESDEEDEDEGEKEKKRRRQSESAALTSSVHSLLFSMPAARGSSTLGALPSSGSGKRSVVIETDSNPPSYGENNQTGLHQVVENHASIPSHGSAIDQTAGSYDSSNASNYSGYAAQNIGEAVADQNSDGYHASYADQSGGNYEYYDNSYENYQMGVDQSTSGGETASYVGHDSYVNQGPSFGSGLSISEVRAMGKKKKGQIPTEIVEVKQDELMKNRPREDQMKSTGIAFGPSYQPVSTKGKPTKLHKRKHQIGSLYFDMRQKEMELNERRAKGFQTKAQTQGKYGW